MAYILKIGWCDYKAAKYAVEHWHYSKSLPPPPLTRLGVWEDGQFIGCVLFGRGSNNNIGRPYSLKQTEVYELVRVALDSHKSPVTRIVKVSIAYLRKHAPGLRLIVSFADPYQGHHGGIYQGGNWIYAGTTPENYKYLDKSGREWHSRQVTKTGFSIQFGQKRKSVKTSDCTRIRTPGKHKYLMPLDKAMRKQIEPLSKPYPKRGRSIDSDVPVQPGEGGASPTLPLHISTEGNVGGSVLNPDQPLQVNHG